VIYSLPIRGGARKRALFLVKPSKVTSFTKNLYNSENNISKTTRNKSSTCVIVRDMAPFCRLLLRHRRIVILLHISYRSERVTRLTMGDLGALKVCQQNERTHIAGNLGFLQYLSEVRNCVLKEQFKHGCGDSFVNTGKCSTSASVVSGMDKISIIRLSVVRSSIGLTSNIDYLTKCELQKRSRRPPCDLIYHFLLITQKQRVNKFDLDKFLQLWRILMTKKIFCKYCSLYVVGGVGRPARQSTIQCTNFCISLDNY